MQSLEDIFDSLSFNPDVEIELREKADTLKAKLNEFREETEHLKGFSKTPPQWMIDKICSNEKEMLELNREYQETNKELAPYVSKKGEALNKAIALLKTETDEYLFNRKTSTLEDKKNSILRIKDIFYVIDELKNIFEDPNASVNVIIPRDKEAPQLIKQKLDLSLYHAGNKSGLAYKNLLLDYQNLIFSLIEKHDYNVLNVLTELEQEYNCNYLKEYGENAENRFKHLCILTYKNENPLKFITKRNLQVFDVEENIMLQMSKTEKVLKVLKKVGLNNLVGNHYNGLKILTEKPIYVASSSVLVQETINNQDYWIVIPSSADLLVFILNNIVNEFLPNSFQITFETPEV